MTNFTKNIFAVLISIILLGFSAERLHAQCNAAFSFVVNAPAVSFIAADSMPQKAHIWNFGDGQTAGGSYPFISHTYYQPGQYAVKHVIFDSANNCTDSTVQTVTVNFTATCQAYFNYYPFGDSLISNGYYFYNTSNVPGGFSAIKSNVWSINGAPAGSSQDLSYTFSQPGTYNVCLDIETLGGCKSQYCQPVTVYSFCNMGASFTYHVDSLYPASATLYPHPDLPGNEYKWRANGYILTTKTPVIQYYQAGTYPATLYVIDSTKNCYDSSAGTFKVPVSLCDTANVSYTWRTDTRDSALVYFSAHSSDSLTSQQWYMSPYYFGNTTDSSQYLFLNTNNPDYRFADTGTWQVCLTANLQHCGTREWCGIVRVISTGEAGGANHIASYPNPAVNSVGLDVNLAAPAAMVVNVYDAGGIKVLSTQQQGVTGGNHINLPVQQLNKGQYFVEIITGKQRMRSVFQKF